MKFLQHAQHVRDYYNYNRNLGPWFPATGADPIWHGSLGGRMYFDPPVKQQSYAELRKCEARVYRFELDSPLLLMFVKDAAFCRKYVVTNIIDGSIFFERFLL